MRRLYISTMLVTLAMVGCRADKPVGHPRPTSPIRVLATALAPDAGWATVGGESQGDEVLSTMNFGRTWSNVWRLPQAASANSIAAVTGRAWILTEDKSQAAYRVFVTSDLGRTWWQLAVLPSEGSRAVEQFAFADATHGWLLLNLGGNDQGDGAELLGTVDGGRLWHQLAHVTSDSDPLAHGLPFRCFKSHIAFATVRVGVLSMDCTGRLDILRTADGGASWTELPLFASVQPGITWRESAASFADSQHGFIAVAGDRGYVYGTRDGGATWSVARQDLSQNAQAVVALTADAWVAADSPFLQLSTGSAAVFQTNAPVTLNCLSESECWVLSMGMMVGQAGGTLWNTFDGGRHWRVANPTA